MKVNICSSGRFHVADLSRELLRNGHDVTFHSYASTKLLTSLGLPSTSQANYLWSVAPMILAQKAMRPPQDLNDKLTGIVHRILDRQYSLIKDSGGVFIGMSGICLRSLRAAKSRGSHVIVERGSTHILEQKRILDAVVCSSGSKSLVSAKTIERELQGYEIADTIAIPSRHVERSFIENGIPQAKLFLNPYGVNLSEFLVKNSPSESQPKYDVINTGTWCRRKGSDFLAKAVLEELGLRLLHVGSVGDLPLPIHPRFEHHPPVPQSQLPEFYANASVFALPSHEEGLAVIQAQALACGLPVVGTTHSGASDLGEWLGLGSPRVQAVSPGSTEELCDAIRNALQWSTSRHQQPPEPIDMSVISWKAYGDRYSSFLHSI